MPSNMIQGSVIMRNANKKKLQATNTQTHLQAARAIRQKYGKILRTAWYYYRGNGDWAMYSKDNDSKHSLKKPYQISNTYKPRRKAHLGDSSRKYKGGRV